MKSKAVIQATGKSSYQLQKSKLGQKWKANVAGEVIYWEINYCCICNEKPKEVISSRLSLIKEDNKNCAKQIKYDYKIKNIKLIFIFIFIV